MNQTKNKFNSKLFMIHLGASEDEIRNLIQSVNNDSVVDEHGASPLYYAVERCTNDYESKCIEESIQNA